MTQFLQPVWDNILRNYFPAEADDRLLFAVTTVVVHELVFITCNLLLYVCHKKNWFYQYKIQKYSYPDGALLRKCVTATAVNQIIVQPFLMYYGYPLFRALGMGGGRSPLPSASTVALHIFGCMVVEDTLFYWSHRLLHHRRIYKYVHKRHHEFKAPIGIASEYAHPVEGLLSNLIPFFAGPILMQAHIFTYLVWEVVRIVETIDAHSGYSFPLSPFSALPWIQGGAEKHDYHHSHNVGCYGSFFTFWDWAMKTDRSFREWKKKQEASAAKAKQIEGKDLHAAAAAAPEQRKHE